MVKAEGAQLVGYLAPMVGQPGFVIPVWRAPWSNQILAQVIDGRDRVVGFQDIEHPSITYDIAQHLEIETGQPSIRAYAFPGEEPVFGTRQALIAWLTPRLRDIEDPLLNLQACEFCGQADAVEQGWRRSFDHLAAVSPRSAAAWRDFVVLPAELREAVRLTVEAHQLDVPTQSLGRDVGVIVEGRRVTLRCEPRLYEAIAEHDRAQHELLNLAEPVCRAFSLDSDIALKATSDEEPLETEDETLDPVIVAVGKRAHEIVSSQYVARSNGQQELFVRWPELEAGLTEATGGCVVTIFQAETLHWQGRHSDFPANFRLPPEAGGLPVVVMFSATASDDLTREVALDMGARIGSVHAGLGPIAVIPHLPDPAFIKDPQMHQIFLSDLAEVFGSVVLLSDQTPHYEYGWPHGPSRTVEAARWQWMDFIWRLEHGALSLCDTGPPGKSAPIRVDVIGSVTCPVTLSADLAVAQAYMRTCSFGLACPPGVHAELIGMPVPSEMEGIELADLLRRTYAWETSFAHKARWPMSMHTLHLSGVLWSAVNFTQFEDACLRELERNGWRVTHGENEVQEIDFRIERDGMEFEVLCRPYGATEKQRPLRNGAPRSRSYDRIVLTDAPVRRTEFMRNYLNGFVVVNFGRIAALPKILEERHAIAINALDRPNGFYKNLFIRSAIALGIFVDEELHKADAGLSDRWEKLLEVADGGSEFEQSNSRITANLILAAGAGSALPWRVRVTLNASGWEVEFPPDHRAAR